MHVTAIQTAKVMPSVGSIFEVLDAALPGLSERSVVVVTSKIVSICEGRVVALGQTDKESLIAAESDWFLPPETGRYGYHFSVVHNTLVAAAGIDESNGDGHYVLWPEDPQKSCNEVRRYLREKHGVREVGVLITDSASQPLRRGAIGIPLAHSGFRALNSYVGTPDLFGRPLVMEQANVASGLAAAAVVAMGEGNEQTPLAVITDAPFVVFQDDDPTPEELAEFYIPLEDDIFAPFLTAANWRKGGSGK